MRGTIVLKYAWADKRVKEAEKVPDKYVNVLDKGEAKASSKFTAFLHRKFTKEMLYSILIKARKHCLLLTFIVVLEQ